MMQVKNISPRIGDFPTVQPDQAGRSDGRSRVSRSSKIRSSIRSDCASSPTRGSRLVGLLSMIITSVLGSGLLEQESENARTTVTRTNLGHKCHVIPREGAGALARRGESRDLGFDRALRSRIRDFPQDRRPLCPGSGRHIRRPPVPGLKRQQRECRRFLRLGRQSEFV